VNRYSAFRISYKPLYVQDEARLTKETKDKIRKHTEGKYEELADDYAVRNTIRALRETGQLERTYVFFVMDNGYLLG
jgi:arylsulfatase A-like enzyme